MTRAATKPANPINSATAADGAQAPNADSPAALARASRPAGIQNDLLRLGVLPCAMLALVLTGWLTHSQLRALDSIYEAEGQSLVRQVASMSDLSLYAGDLPTLQNVADAALRTGQATRVEISNSAGIYVSAGLAPSATQRIFSAPVLLREVSQTAAFAPPGSSAAGPQPIGMVQAYRDASALSQARAAALGTSAALALVALIAAWLAARQMAQKISQPLAQISGAVAALQAGRFQTRCDLMTGSLKSRPHHELQMLASDVNQLASHLEQHQSKSEARVREATTVALARMADAEQSALSRARFLAAASHDLRQPVHAMGLFIDSLLANASPAQRPPLARLQESASFMGLLLDDLLEISRLDAQVLAPACRALRLAPIFEALAAQHAPQAAQARVNMVWKDRGLAVHSDPALLQRVLGNLVVNAIRHVPLGGCVLVVARERQGGVRIEVRDNGVGVAPVHHAHIFEEFYQVNNTERDRRQGFGLGLAICTRIAKMLNTRIQLRSALAQGSTFSIQLPGASPHALARTSTAEGPAAAPPCR